MKKDNVHINRESWLRAATDEVSSHFAKHGYTLPDKTRCAIAFTSMGKRGRIPTECWHASRSADQHYEIIIRNDVSEPLEVLERLVPALIHTLLPAHVKFGKEYKEIAHRIGLEGPMRHAKPTPLLKEYLQTLATNLGPLPHARLDSLSNPETRARSGTRAIKAECSICGYWFRILPKLARTGLRFRPSSTCLA